MDNKPNEYLTSRSVPFYGNRLTVAEHEVEEPEIAKNELSQRDIEWNEYFYKRLPKIYREYDVFTQYQLKRYLETIVESGLTPLIYETERIERLVDPSTCPGEYLPLLCEMYGIEYFEDIPEIYQRRFLKILTELYKIKGTMTVIEYIARELSGLRVEIEKIGEEYRIRLQTFEEDQERLLIEQDIISRYVSQFIPVNVYARVVVSYNFYETHKIDAFTEVLGVKIKEFLTSEVDNDKGGEIYKTSSRVSDTQGESVKVKRVDTESYELFSGAKSSITNVAVIGVTLHTNVINGIDIIKDKGIEISDIIH